MFLLLVEASVRVINILEILDELVEVNMFALVIGLMMAIDDDLNRTLLLVDELLFHLVSESYFHWHLLTDDKIPESIQSFGHFDELHSIELDFLIE